MPHHCRSVRTQQIGRDVRLMRGNDDQVGVDCVSELKDLILRRSRHGVSLYLICRNFELLNNLIQFR